MIHPADQLERRRFNVEDYHRMAEVGLLGEDDRIELLDGELVQMTPIGPRHLACVNRLTRAFTHALGERAIVQVQGAIRLGGRSELQPDLAILKPAEDFYASHIPGPNDVLLLIEVADSSYTKDRHVKLDLYARAGIPELWIIDINEDQPRLELHRQPNTDKGLYERVDSGLRGDQTIGPETISDLSFPVSNLLGL